MTIRGIYINIVRKMHYKCRNSNYPRCKTIHRAIVPDDKVEWTAEWNEYQPVSYTSPHLHGQPWADPEIGPNFHPEWNSLVGTLNRISHNGPYIVKDGLPLNPRGRTGVAGRGCLGRWGPNHAADPIVTRWLRDAKGRVLVHNTSKLPILQFVAIQRRDCKEWALPGGMVDPGELVTTTLQREFLEEALNSLDQPKEDTERLVSEFFTHGQDVYRGYVDDPRNTDNAWIETVAVNFHDEEDLTVGRLHLQAGDDAQGVQWMDLSNELQLYASHKEFLATVAHMHKAHWSIV